MDLSTQTDRKIEYLNWCLSGKDFLLDSGAYAFMRKTKFQQNFDITQFDNYVEEYINFINKFDIQHFFEMDLDNMIGYDKVKEYRQKIEKATGKKVIPVWHDSRGIVDFVEMCENYSYVAIGGIASKELTDRAKIKALCKIAHAFGCKIHGLGYLSLVELNNNAVPFDTVDGTSWQAHIRGELFFLQNGQLQKKKDKRHWKELALENYNLWKQYGENVQ